MAFGGAPRDPEELEAEAAPVEAALSPSMTLGEVQLTVSELERSVAYYQRAVGLELLEQGAGRATMGVAGRPLLGLIEEPGARPAPGHTGLYHFALLLPRRADLARWLLHAARDEVALVGLSDHFVSEALYLSDPDGHGIEIYWDRPRETWEGQVAARMTTAPLDVDDLMGELDEGEGEAYAGLPAGCTMGHIHLKVASIPDGRFLPRCPRARADGPARSPGGFPRRGRLPPPCGGQHLGERRWVPAAAWVGGPATGDDRPRRRRRARRRPRAPRPKRTRRR